MDTLLYHVRMRTIRLLILQVTLAITLLGVLAPSAAAEEPGTRWLYLILWVWLRLASPQTVSGRFPSVYRVFARVR
jgi:hypothetical protein